MQTQKTKKTKKPEKTVEFVDWCPKNFKFGLSTLSPTVVPDDDIAKS